MSNDSVLRRDRRGDADPEGKPCGDGGRDGRDTATSAQGHLEPPELEEAGRPLPGACGGSKALGHLDLRRPVSRTERGRISAIFNLNFEQFTWTRKADYAY